ncbi:MAG: asparagine synthase (glutamine-hydrolyzing) [Clostridia bacterium]|nr:asparagine synthase (glutamine-hydrolyzing) [Clostridia bacterium]
MCAINGLINLADNKKQAKNILNKMQQVLNSNYPHRCQVFTHAQVALGGNYLCHTYHGKKYVIIYQGRLDNTKALSKKLDANGIKLRTATDAEIIVKLFALEGTKMFRKLNGNFAFALYEIDNQRLFLVRDPLGIKPLFYAVQKDGLAFSDKIKALFLHPQILPCVNLDGLRELFGVCPARTPGKTVYKNINEVKPGAYLCWQNGKITSTTYFKLVSRPHQDSSSTTMKKVKTLLRNALQNQLPQNARTGFMLSGGLDSSTITALAAQNNPNLKTFSVDYVGNQENFQPTDFSPTRDNYYINLVAKQYATQHQYHLLNSSDLCQTLREALIARDYPSMADIDSSLLLFSRALKQDVDVCFSGEFADEIFCGYPWFYRADTAKVNTFPWAIDLSIRENTIAKHLRPLLKIKDFVTQTFANAIAEVPLAKTDTPADRRMKTYSYLTMRWFGLNLLERGDRMSAYCDLDIRIPFTDLKLVQYVYNIPWEMKNYGGQEKGILRAAVANLLPAEVINRKKCPYPKTVDPVYTNLIEQSIRTLLADEDHPVWQIVDMNYVNQVLNDHTPQSTRPWFGQLMQRPQYLAFIYQIAMWLVEYQIIVELPKR